MRQILEWAEKQQKASITSADVPALGGTEACPMHCSEALSRNLWGFLNFALAGTVKYKDFCTASRNNGLEAWRKLVTPLRPRTEAKRTERHTAVHAPPKSKDLSEIIADLVDWEEIVERFELCGGTVSEAD